MEPVAGSLNQTGWVVNGGGFIMAECRVASSDDLVTPKEVDMVVVVARVAHKYALSC